MAKQTFTTGQVLTAAQMTSLQQTAMLGGDASAKVASYVLVAADAGTAISMSNGSATTITVNTGLFAAGDIVTIINLGAGVCTITAGTATVTTSGSLALAQNQGGVLRFTSASAAIFFQFATPASGDIEGVTAGTGISGGGTSGTVTITNSMATEITAKGDLIVGTGNATFDNLPVGTNGYTLVADSVETTGLKWVAPAGGGANWSLLNAGGTALTGAATITVSGISGKDKILVQVRGASSASVESTIGIRINGDTASNYKQSGGQVVNGDASAYNTDESAIVTGSMSTNAASIVSAAVEISGGNASGVKAFFSSGGGTAAGGAGQVVRVGGGVWDNSATISSISVFSFTGNFDAGNVFIYTSA
jgi:hypothetical protein